MGGPNPSLAGGLPKEEQGLLPSCPMSPCRILKLTQDCVEKCFPFQYANKNKMISNGCALWQDFSVAESSNELFCNEG